MEAAAPAAGAVAEAEADGKGDRVIGGSDHRDIG